MLYVLRRIIVFLHIFKILNLQIVDSNCVSGHNKIELTFSVHLLYRLYKEPPCFCNGYKAKIKTINVLMRRLFFMKERKRLKIS